MVGREFSEIFPAKSGRRRDARVLFSFDGILHMSNRRVAFSVREGEVLGVGGLQGQGQLELLQSIFGLGGCESLSLKIGIRPVTVKNPIHAMRHGIALVPGEPQRGGGLPHSLRAGEPVRPHGRSTEEAGFHTEKEESSVVQRYGGPPVHPHRLAAPGRRNR